MPKTTSLDHLPTYSKGVIQSRRATNATNTMLGRISATGGIRIAKDWNQGLKIIGEDARNLLTRFRIDQAGDNSIRVNQGKWTRNGVVVDSPVDGGETYYTVSGLSDTSATYYVILNIYDTSGNSEDGLDPDDMTIEAQTTLPTESNDLENEYRVIGTVDTDSDGNITTIAQYWLGDIDDIGWMPDSDTKLTDPPPSNESPYTRSLDTKSGTYHKREAMLFDFESPGSATSFDSTNDYIVMRQNDRGDGTGPDVIYSDRQNFVEEYLDDGDYLTDYIIGELTGVFKHVNLDFGNSISGQAGQNEDHDDRYWYSYDADSEVDTKSFHTTGEVHADDFKLQDAPATNYWNAEDFKATASTAITLSAPTLAIASTVNLTVNGNTAQSITNWTTLGILTGTTVVEKQVQNLGPTDKVLCIPGA